MTPLVTVAIPTFNGTDYLRETLSSLLAQDYPNLDILVSDNGSTDGSLALASSLAKGDPRVRFRRNETTVPIHEHYNQCSGGGPWYVFSVLDDDDLLSPNFVSELVAVAMRHPGVDIVLPRNVTIDAEGLMLREYGIPAVEVVDGFRFVCDWLYGRTAPMFACVGTVLLRTATLRNFGGYQAFALGQNIDNLVLLQCAVGKQVGFSAEAVFKWRVYATSFASKPKLRQLAKSTQRFLRHLEQDPQTVAALSALPLAQRKEISDGVRFRGAHDLLARMKFFEGPLSIHKLRQLVVFPLNGVFYRLVLEHYVTRLRHRLTPRRASSRADAG